MAADFPFLHQDYLALLESSGAVSANTGWEPCHQESSSGELFIPLYRKWHSRGEYVFDQGWAQAWEQQGGDYYPKLLTAIPFTPVEGPRWRGHGTLQKVLHQVREQLEQEALDSWHLLFVTPELKREGEALGLVARASCHFEWYNRGYGDFQGFLSVLHAAKRKTLRKERARVQQYPLQFFTRPLPEVPAEDWQHFYPCYAMTYYERGQRPYLPQTFFDGLRQSALAQQIYLISAHDGDGLVAAALFFHDDRKLYGRYWGSLKTVPGLHFELCFYRGMELCMALGLAAFDPGVQGEHKLIRGFEPVMRWSLHDIRDLRFRQAVERFCREEQRQVERYYQEARTLLPFRQA